MDEIQKRLRTCHFCGKETENYGSTCGDFEDYAAKTGWGQFQIKGETYRCCPSSECRKAAGTIGVQFYTV